MVKVVQPQLGSRIPYVALSHCWGGRLPLKTIKANLEHHKIGFDQSGLPKTFQDAFSVTKKLGYQHIWIDSLCIVQDDADDWAREAASMASIYESAQLTIAATWGGNGDAGCFHDALPAFVVKVLDNGVESQLFMRPKPDEKKFVYQAPLNTRGWTLQERLLSFRTLSFAEDQMHWNCLSLSASEDGLEFNDTATESLTPRDMSSILYWEAYENTDDIDNALQLRESWDQVIRQYALRNLTFAKDKLVALAGMTEAYARIFAAEPVVGLWKGELSRQLLWYTVGHDKETDHEAVKTLNLPSWTWLKLKGSLGGYAMGPDSFLTDVDAIVTWRGIPMIAPLSKATITGRAKMFRVLKVTKRQGKFSSNCMCGVDEKISLETGASSVDVMRYTWFLDECVDILPRDVFCMMVHGGEVPGRWGVDPLIVKVSALVVSQEPGISDEYRRLGVVYFENFPRNIFDACVEQNFRLV